MRRPLISARKTEFFFKIFANNNAGKADEAHLLRQELQERPRKNFREGREGLDTTAEKTGKA